CLSFNNHCAGWLTACLTASLRASYPRAGRRLVDHADGRSHYTAEVNDVPDAAPGDQRGDAERADLAAEPVHHPRVRDVPVADAVEAGARADPGVVGGGQ